MNPEITPLEAELFVRLVAGESEGAGGWEPEPPSTELRSAPTLVARLALVARPVGNTRRRFVAGCPVIHHPDGQAIAAAAGSSWIAVRSNLPAGALARSGAHAFGSSQPGWAELGWVELDPWAPDTAFARTIDLLRAHVTRAYENAEPEP